MVPCYMSDRFAQTVLFLGKSVRILSKEATKGKVTDGFLFICISCARITEQYFVLTRETIAFALRAVIKKCSFQKRHFRLSVTIWNFHAIGATIRSTDGFPLTLTIYVYKLDGDSRESLRWEGGKGPHLRKYHIFLLASLADRDTHRCFVHRKPHFGSWLVTVYNLFAWTFWCTTKQENERPRAHFAFAI